MKQALMILLAIFIFDLTVPNVNAIGIALTLAGGAWYAAVEHREKAASEGLIEQQHPEF
jgi:hypothetical protein